MRYFILLLVVIFILYGLHFFGQKYQKNYLPIHQGIVNQFGTMPVKQLNNIIVRQFHYFIRKNAKTPLIIKYNIFILVLVYALMIKSSSIPFNNDFFSFLFSILFLLMLSLSLTESYMHKNISQRYVDSFWQDYLNGNKDNKLKVVVHYAYSPVNDSHLKLMWYATFTTLSVLIYWIIISVNFWV